MSRRHHVAQDELTDRRKNRHHVRSIKSHRKNPCPHSPRTLDVYIDLDGEFVKHPGHKRHNRWTAPLRWTEVDVDTDGFPIIVLGYDVIAEYTANGTDWFIASKHHVPAKQDTDPGPQAQIILHHIHGRLAYRYKVRARTKTCKAEFSDYFDLGTPIDAPPAPSDVTILRAASGIKCTWAIEPDEDDDRDFTQDVASFFGELWLHNEFDAGHSYSFTAAASDDKITIATHGFANGDALTLHRTIGGAAFPGGLKPWRCYYVRDVTTNTFKVAHTAGGTAINVTADGDGTALWGLVRTARHEHKHKHVFEIDPDDFDEDQRFYSRWLSVSDHRSKSEFIPATGSPGNDDPGATAVGRRPAWPRRVFTFTFPGDAEEKVYVTPERADDDYRIRRVTVGFHNPPTGGATKFDIKINAGTFVFDGDTAKMTKLESGAHDASSKQVVNSTLERGDHLRVKVASIAGTAPGKGTVQVICDRLADGTTADSGGGGGEIVLEGPLADATASALVPTVTTT